MRLGLACRLSFPAGMPRLGAVVLVLMQGYAFALPAWITGLIAAGVTLLGVRQAFNRLIGVQLPALLTGQAIGLATLVGLLVPGTETFEALFVIGANCISC